MHIFKIPEILKCFQLILKQGLHGRSGSGSGSSEDPRMTAEAEPGAPPKERERDGDGSIKCSQAAAAAPTAAPRARGFPPGIGQSDRADHKDSRDRDRELYDPEYASMEAWLDEHPEFVQDYFLRKASRNVVDTWVVSHATSTTSHGHGGPQGQGQGQPGAELGSSGATTPVRKISAHEFGGLDTPIVNKIAGTPTFLSVTTSVDGGASGQSSSIFGTSSQARTQRLSRHELKHLDEKELIFELVKDICNELDVRSLCHKILQNVITLLHADRGSLFLVQGERGYTSCGHSHSHSFSEHSNSNSISSNSGAAASNGTGRPEQVPERVLEHASSPGKLAKEGAGSVVVGCPVTGSTNVGSLGACARDLDSDVFPPSAHPNHPHTHTHPHPRPDDGELSDSGDPPGCSSRVLVSKLFDVCSKSTLEEMEKKEEIRIPWGAGIVGYVAASGQSVNIPDAYQDERFNHDIDARTGYKTQSMLCMPINDFNGDVIGVAQVINKQGDSAFTPNDEKVFESYLQFCGIGLRNAQLYEKSQLEVKRNQVLLDLARMIFEEQSTIEHMVFRILTHMQSLIQCQRVQILLVHKASKGSFSRVFDFEASDLETEDSEERTSPFESRFPVNVGITGYVATTGETVNIVNAYEDERFDPAVDENSGFKHKNILCMPIKNASGQIIGVIQLINKFDDLSFTKNDENFVEAFAIFCGMGIHNTHMYEKTVIAMAKQSVTLEVLSYHASATLEDAQRLNSLYVPSAATFRLYDFKFDDINMEDMDTLKACLRMFMDLGLMSSFNIDKEVLCRWLLSVKKNYRNVIYHNWRHAFNVAQMMFAIITATQWWKHLIIDEIECLSLMIACLCHDLDHRGTNNSFQIKASSPLAQLYSTSTMEHHHFDQCVMILNSQGNQILSNISSEEYSRVIKVLEDAILSTDLAVYFRKRGAFLNLVKEREYDWSKEEHRELLRGMTMTVCDLAAITKPWDVEKRVAELVSSEFFEQGDIEREELNITPIDIMNREKEDQLPMMQVGFIDSICLPIYEAFAELSEELEPLVEGVRENKKNWLDLAEERRRHNCQQQQQQTTVNEQVVPSS
ncbi:unnamed protein product [Bemisia tabaci]|uniref:Phosphodiesterase n=1 Tax=Bemisia tabaci TaxID=7038 RepID=A0A9P0G2Q5_BEMTA|nr:unnamed protein product [Bemisia tabaci]